MNDKSRNIDTPCGPFALNDLSNKQFLKDHYKLVKPYLDNDHADEVPSILSIDDLKSIAEQEFRSHYGTFPTCAVFAPGCLTVAGKNANLVESKSLSMAIQLVTVVVGKRSRGSKWCYVKTLSNEITDSKVFDIHLNIDEFNLSMESTSWIRYVKGTIRSFKDRRAYVPGFKIVIASNVPMKRGLGSSAALVVALYTFLEAITNTYTTNRMEKILACHLAEKLAAYPCDVRIGDILTSVIGNEDKIYAFDPRSLHIQEHVWDSLDVAFVFIECDRQEPFKQCTNIKQHKEVITMTNTASRWRNHPRGDSLVELLFSQETISMSRETIDEDKRVEKIIDTIRTERWDKLGKLLGENYHYKRECLSSLSDDIELVINGLKSIEGILGFAIIGRDYGASVMTLVQKSKLKSFISYMKRTKIMSQQRYYIMKSFRGASTLYSYERRFLPLNGGKCRNNRSKIMSKYYLDGEDNSKLKYYNKFENINAIPLFIPCGGHVG